MTRPDNTQQLRRRRQRCTVQCVQYSVYSVHSVYSVYSADECGEQGVEECPVAAPPAPLHPLTIWGARPGTSSVDSSPGGDNDAEIRISCIFCCHILTSYLLCALTDD